MTPLPVYILAGGRSTRFGSDKALAQIDGQPLLTRIAGSIEPIARSITVVADRAGKYEALSLTTIADHEPDLGPLAGTLSALCHCKTHVGPGWIMLCSCDLLVVKPQWFELLYSMRSDACLAVAFKPDRWQPLVGLYHTDLIETIEDQFKAGQDAMWQLLDCKDVGAVAVDPPDDWPQRLQANRPGDLPI
jgi:molybdopterin-guanine dinucleotide biosynthesis protein A